jgi:probable F420-dependent oxidoreductase
MQLSKFAVWTPTDAYPAKEAARFAQRVEEWGYSALWLPDAVARDPLVHSAFLLEHTEKLILATGITSIYGRDARAARNSQMTLNEQSGGRFLLGLGVSHRPFVEGMRGHNYGPPIATMKQYLEDMDKVDFMGQKPPEAPKRVIAALGPKMLELSKTHCDGAHPYLVTPKHTRQARGIIGPDRWLCVEQKVLLETDADKAREIARKALGIYLSLPNYRNNLIRLGFEETALDNGGTDEVVDALVAWGDETAIAARLNKHIEAGATQVCIQALDPEGKHRPDERILKALAPGG